MDKKVRIRVLKRSACESGAFKSIEYRFHDHKREGVGLLVGVVIGGGRRTRTSTRRTHKERNKDPVRHDKETDRYGRTNASGDQDYCGKDQTQ